MQPSPKEQYYYLKPGCDALCELHYKIKAEESKTLRMYAEKVFGFSCFARIAWRNMLFVLFITGERRVFPCGTCGCLADLQRDGIHTYVEMAGAQRYYR